MDTSRISERDRKIIEWIIEGMAAGDLRAEPEYDANQQIIAVKIKLAQPQKRGPLQALDPRRTKPL